MKDTGLGGDALGAARNPRPSVVVALRFTQPGLDPKQLRDARAYRLAVRGKLGGLRDEGEVCVHHARSRRRAAGSSTMG